jgi:hypothetical protein
MGATISLLFSATFSDQIQNLVLLEGVGPLEKQEKDITRHRKLH